LIERQIDEEFVSTGQVRFVYRHFAFLGPESVRAAEATECAAEQGMFWEYHDTLFENWAGENRGAFSDANLERFARNIDLNEEQFSQCMEERRYLPRVEADIDAARGADVRSTPTIFINGEHIGALQTYEDYRQAILEALGDQG
jgi:protein-disulfide isomerase